LNGQIGTLEEALFEQFRALKNNADGAFKGAKRWPKADADRAEQGAMDDAVRALFCVAAAVSLTFF